MLRCIAVIAQVVEHALGKGEVNSANLFNGSLMKLSGLELTKEWATRSVAPAVSPEFASEFSKFCALARTLLFWRRRFEPKISLAATFLFKRLLSNAIFRS